MKRLSKSFMFFLLLLGSTMYYAQKYYDEQWKKIEENSTKGTFKSNLPLILDIQNHAMKDNNTLQLIRSLKAEFAIVNQTRDDEQNNAASKFFSKLTDIENKLKGDEKIIYKVLMNGFITDYYNRNSWKINGRTNINSQDISQIETWSKLDFKNYLTKGFKDLDQQKAEMKKIALAPCQSLFTNTKSISFFPTLADWYALKKVDFLSDNDLFTKNELSDNRKQINDIFNELIAQNNGNAKLYFMHQKLQENCNYNQCKDKLQQLNALLNSNIKGDYKVLIMDDIMNELLAKKQEKEALEMATKAQSQYPQSPFIENIKNKEEQIKMTSLNIQYEKQTQSNKPIHFVAEYKNLSSFSLNIYKVTDDLKSFLQYSRNPYPEMFDKVKKELIKKETYQISDPKDYQLHKTSLEIKPLSPGIYVAEYIVNGGTNDKNQNFYFLVSDHKIIYKNKVNTNFSENELKLVNSENGEPVSNEGLTFYEFSGNSVLNMTTGKTDNKGVFRFPSSSDKEYYRAFLIQQPKTNDFQMMQVYGNNYDNEFDVDDEVHTKTQIFTDRAIYRPGQTVYFKVINTKINKEVESVDAGLKQKIMLGDANGKEVSSQNFTTNEFGSYHGSFILPKGKLNGEFYLNTNGETPAFKGFSVEEYKRPKFEVNFEPVKEEYKYGQTIELKGKATTFSGIALSNTKVNYEIKKR
ncbi:MAG: MG2 domain-containing protein, partial [Chryseobacterium taeanense]